MFLFTTGDDVFVILEEAEEDERQATTQGVTPCVSRLDKIVVTADKNELKKDKLENKEEVSNHRVSNPAYEIEVSEAGVKGISKPHERENRDVSEMKKRKSSEDVSATQIEEELNKESKRIKSFGDSFERKKAGKTTAGKNGELPALNGVCEDISSDETPAKIPNDTKPQLVTVREGCSLTAPKQKVVFSKESQDDAALNDTVSNSEISGPQENLAKQNFRSDSQVSDVSTLDKEIKRGVLQSKSTPEQDYNEKTVVNSTKRLEDEKELSLNSSNISKENDTRKAKREFAGEIILPEKNKTLSKNGGKSQSAGQSESGKQSRDDSPKVLNLPQNRDLGPRNRTEDKRKNERYGESEGKKQTEFKDKHEPVVLPSVTVEQDNSLNDGDDETPKTLNEPSGNKRGHSTEGTEKRRRLSEADLNLRPLSPVMEDGESDKQLLNPSAGRSAKVKKSKSFVARGFSKMFGSKRKYKVDKELRENSFSSECESQTTQAEFDQSENHGGAKENKKKKKTKGEENHGGEKISDGQSTDEGKSKHSSRKFGGLFSRGKKKEMHSHSKENK